MRNFLRQVFPDRYIRVVVSIFGGIFVAFLTTGVLIAVNK